MKILIPYFYTLGVIVSSSMLFSIGLKFPAKQKLFDLIIFAMVSISAFAFIFANILAKNPFYFRLFMAIAVISPIIMVLYRKSIQKRKK